MNHIGKLIKAKTISFNEMLIKYYPKLNLNETEAMILMVLYIQQNETGEVLSTENLIGKVSLNEEELSSVILSLINKGFLELLIDDNNKEKFSIDSVIEKLGELITNNDTSNTKYDRQEIMSDLVDYIEKSYQKILSSSDLMIINNWLDLNYKVEDIKQAILDSLKAKKMHLKYADAILVNRKKDRVQVNNVDDDIRKMLENVYVKTK